MATGPKVIPAGAIVVVTNGVYEEYRTHGIYRVLTDFAPRAAQIACMTDPEHDAGRVYFTEWVVKWAIQNGYLELDRSYELFIPDSVDDEILIYDPEE